jgi:hypothetical protein
VIVKFYAQGRHKIVVSTIIIRKNNQTKNLFCQVEEYRRLVALQDTGSNGFHKKLIYS